MRAASWLRARGKPCLIRLVLRYDLSQELKQIAERQRLGEYSAHAHPLEPRTLSWCGKSTQYYNFGLAIGAAHPLEHFKFIQTRHHNVQN